MFCLMAITADSEDMQIHRETILSELKRRFSEDGIEVSEELQNVILSDLVEAHCQSKSQIQTNEIDAMLDDISHRPIGVANTSFKVCVMGGGAFGTAMACALARRGHHVTILMLPDEAKHAENINKVHKNSMCFADVILPASIKASTNAEDALADASLVFHAIPVQYSRKYLQKVKKHIPQSCPIISVSKGISMDTLSFMDDILREELGDAHPLAFVAGPSFAIGIIQGEPTWCTLAASDVNTARSVQKLISSSTFRTYYTTDVVGLEACSALKNVLSILCGMSLALGHSPNTTNGLLTRAWADLRLLVIGLGGRSETMSALCGIGDLMLTCYGGLSRNAKFGQLLAEGLTIEKALEGAGGVVEGLPTSKAVQKLAEKLKIKIPVLNSVALLLDGKLTPRDMVTYVMTLPLSEEFPGLPALSLA
ncbi:glycerol-3-phosphate dehydrogenase [Perkinsela sp. CCAP 1560/4]|nr:glycerol-3-phosphate dehydrogenase [Perkinsela sp. CCAP 1560/4]|eukprot:KNH08475.1 glycerol-3-phosphate dehydrogenase [Perkinsela sp. CCAP 1560/4]